MALWHGFLQIIGIVFVLVLINVAGKLLFMPICIMMDYSIRIYTISMKLPILYLKWSRVEISIEYDVVPTLGLHC